MKTLLGKKIGMTQIFAEDGTVIPVTVVEAGPETVVQIKTVEKDGYDAVQVGYEDQKPQRVNKPMSGHFAKAGVDTKKHLAEFKPGEGEAYEVGQVITVADFEEGMKLDVTGTSKGKGTQGNIKRHGHRRGPMTHQETRPPQRTYDSRFKAQETRWSSRSWYLSFKSLQGQQSSWKNGKRQSHSSERSTCKEAR